MCKAAVHQALRDTAHVSLRSPFHILKYFNRLLEGKTQWTVKLYKQSGAADQRCHDKYYIY